MLVLLRVSLEGIINQKETSPKCIKVTLYACLFRLTNRKVNMRIQRR